MHSLAVYDLVSALLRGHPVSALQRHRAFDAPLALWDRVLAFEGCAVQVDRALRAADAPMEVPEPLRRLLREASSTALRHGLLVHEQLPAVAELANAHGIPVLALKGAARLVAGELPGARSIADIDLLVPPDEATRFHALLQAELGYHASGPGYSHHLPGLTRARSLGIEVHFRLSDMPLALDTDIWRDTGHIYVGDHAIKIPSPTSQLLHALEHAIGLNWASRYRLRDMLDVAALFTPEVSVDTVRWYVGARTEGAAFETLLAAANAIEPRVPWSDAGAWRTLRRVARTRLAVAVHPRRAVVAERLFRYAGILAEGSPRTLMRAGLGLARRLGAAAFAAGSLLLGGCLDSTGPARLAVPAFVFVSDVDGIPAIYRFDDGVIARLSAAGTEDVQPHSAAGRIVFTSWRDANAEVYIADLALGGQQRLTTDPSFDGEPVLDPTGATIAFVSSRSGTPRVWLMDATGANPRALQTGSTTFVPEVAPVWSPSGDRIAFTSTRTGTSQVFVVPAVGAVAEQLSHESSGAFTPSWVDGGTAVVYMTLSGGPRLVVVPAAGGDATPLASSDDGLSEPACAQSICLAVTGALGGAGDVIAISRSGATRQALVARAADDRGPAFLIP